MYEQLNFFEPQKEKANVKELVDRGAIFFSNHSGGKDSQAMFLYLQSVVPRDQLIVIHSHLPEVEWEGTEDHIRKYLNGHRLEVCQANKTFFEMVEHRGMFPSPSTRQCTSNLKTAPLEKLIRKISKELSNGLIVNCMGMRAQESSSRAKKLTYKLSEKNSRAGREWYDWLPIHDWREEKVFRTIAEAGQKPFWTYGEGMKRKSCCFCIMACKNDLSIAARLRPQLMERIVATEVRIGHTMIMPTKKHGKRYLNEIV